jgi:hypothetical protein
VPFDDILRYDPVADTWTVVGRMSVARHAVSCAKPSPAHVMGECQSHTCAAHSLNGDVIYVTGGWQIAGPSKYVERFDARTFATTQLTSLPTGLDSCGSLVRDGALEVLLAVPCFVL